MKEEEIRKIVREEMNKNYTYGSPQVPPHHHDSSDNLQIESKNIIGFTPIPSGNTAYRGIDNSAVYGFASAKTLQIPAFEMQGNPNALYPLPIVFSNSATSFQGGYAPEGTITLFIDSTILNTAQLWALIGGTWYGVNLSTTP